MDYRNEKRDFHAYEEYLEKKGIRTTLSDTDIRILSEFIRTYSGLMIRPEESHLFEKEIGKRVKSLNIKTFRDYCEFLAYSKWNEKKQIHLMDSFQAEEQEFFMGPMQLEYFVDVLMPEMASKISDKKHKLKIWCPTCASGAEPYTVSMLMDYVLQEHGFPYYSILASDISTGLLFKAIMGIYDENATKSIPLPFRKKYLLKSRNPRERRVRIAPELRERILFRRINPIKKYPNLTRSMDIIFYRNTIVYLDNKNRSEIINNLCTHLNTGGYLLLGQNESIDNLKAPLIKICNSVYRKTNCK